jgi:peroxiredoxin
MSLQKECQTFYDWLHQPTNAGHNQVTPTLRAVTAAHKASFDLSSVIQPGAHLPSFTLPDATGTPISSSQLLENGPILINFYRGSWCPYCSFELRALQKLLPEFQKRNVTLVAISGELPNSSLDTKSKNELEFTVLSDVDNVFARKLGIVWKQPDVMKDVLAFAEWKKRYGNEKMELPVPGTLLVDKSGVVRNVFVEANWHERLEPQTSLEWIDALESER